MPTKINYRANIYALKQAGCTHVIATSACGSLQENCHPGDFVFIDQFVDRTTKRTSTLYDGEEGHLKGVCHAPMDEPFCEPLRQVTCCVFNIISFNGDFFNNNNVFTFCQQYIFETCAIARASLFNSTLEIFPDTSNLFFRFETIL
jgi:purine nucleoside phosphorylase